MAATGLKVKFVQFSSDYLSSIFHVTEPFSYGVQGKDFLARDQPTAAPPVGSVTCAPRRPCSVAQSLGRQAAVPGVGCSNPGLGITFPRSIAHGGTSRFTHQVNGGGFGHLHRLFSRESKRLGLTDVPLRLNLIDAQQWRSAERDPPRERWRGGFNPSSRNNGYREPGEDLKLLRILYSTGARFNYRVTGMPVIFHYRR